MEEQFIVSARKYRPDSWDTVVGQGNITSTLQNAINNNQIAQAYLFCGPRGVGKTTCARIFAKEINVGVSEDNDLSFNVFELDAASNNSVEDIRSITDQVRIPPQVGKYKVYIIDEVHMLSQAAFNAFLKTLEEPPPHAIFILATTEKHKIIPTILSRCQIFDFNRIGVKDTIAHLAKIAEKESVTVDEHALQVIAQKADGALRDALSIFDQLVAFCGREFNYEDVIKNLNVLDYDYYFRISESIIKEDISSALLNFNEILNKGFDGHFFIIGLGEHFRNLLVCKDPQTVELMEMSESLKKRYQEQAAEMDIRVLVQAMEFTNESDIQYRTSKNQRLLVELMLMKICSIKYNMAEKKKPNFSIKPFKRRNAKPKTIQVDVRAPQAAPPIQAPIPETIIAPPETVQVINEPAAKPIVKPLNRKNKLTMTSTGSVSLSSLFDEAPVVEKPIKEEGGIIEETESRAKSDFSNDDFANAWKGFAMKLKEQGNMSMYNTLVSDIPQVMGGVIKMKISNSVQQIDIGKMRVDLLDFLKSKLDNYSISLEVELIKDDSNKISLYSDKDKYDAMLKQNPALDDFRVKLNLDLEM